MILYRIISEEEYKGYQDGSKSLENGEKKSWDMANKIYENETDSNIDYIYFFPYYEACLHWEGKYVIKVDIPDELIEKGIGTYAHPYGASLNTAFVLLDEYRIKRQDFDPQKYIVETILTEELEEGEVGNKWEKSEEYNKRLSEALSKQTPLFNGHILDYSGIPEPDEFKVPDEAKEITEIIKRKLNEQIEEKPLIARPTIQDKKQNERRYGMYIENAPGYFVREIVQKYGIEEISTLFNEEQKMETIKAIVDVLRFGYIYDKIGNIYIGRTQSTELEQNNKNNLLYIAQEISKIGLDDKEVYSEKLIRLRKCTQIALNDQNNPFQIKDIIRYIYGDDLSLIDRATVNRSTERKRIAELRNITEDPTKTKEEQEAQIKAKLEEMISFTGQSEQNEPIAESDFSMSKLQMKEAELSELEKEEKELNEEIDLIKLNEESQRDE